MKIPIYNSDEHHEGEQEPDAADAASLGSPETLGEPTGAPAGDLSASPDGRVQALEAALANKAKEYETTREQLLRLMADFDNYRKRMTRQYEEARQFAMADLVMGLLPGIDNLERALSAARQDTPSSNAVIAEGVSMVLRQLKEALGKVGVHEVPTHGLSFDPTHHEAVDIVSVPASEDGMIVAEVQRGYLLHDRLLRPAKVVVGRAARDVNSEGT